MLEVLQFYVSGFWVWAGLTVGLTIAVSGTVNLLSAAARMVRK
ncbi:hypothetical protein [Sulfitobacter sp. 1A15106]